MSGKVAGGLRNIYSQNIHNLWIYHT